MQKTEEIIIENRNVKSRKFVRQRNLFEVEIWSFSNGKRDSRGGEAVETEFEQLLLRFIGNELDLWIYLTLAAYVNLTVSCTAEVKK